MNDKHPGSEIDTTSMHRPSLRVKQAAELLQISISTVYKLIHTGFLEAHHVGNHHLRIFSDSLRDYQERQKVIAANPHSQTPSHPTRKDNPWRSNAHRNALALLKQAGVI